MVLKIFKENLMEHPGKEFIGNEELRSINHMLPADYLLVLSPHEELWKQVRMVKEKFANDYKCETARAGLPHITLVAFRQRQVFEARIRQKLKSITNGLSPFKVELKDFGSFPSHTIYIRIVSKVQIVDAVKALRNSQRLMKLDKNNKPFFITEPHLTIARRLQPWQYEKGWLEFEHRHFHGRFIADQALLLKRKAGESYKVIERFMFNGVKQTIQATLF